MRGRRLCAAVMSVVVAGLIAAPADATPSLLAPAPARLPRRIAMTAASDGAFAPVQSVAGHTVVWVTHYHPLSAHPEVVATGAVLEQSLLRAGLFNGSTLPGGGPWKNGSRVAGAALPALVAGFNGGFEFKHLLGGYKTEGRTLKALRAGDATLAISKGGVLKLGVYGVDFTDNGAWKSFRQNLVPLVKAGRSMAATQTAVYWGYDFGRQLFVPRSAVCTRADGRLMYVYATQVDITLFANSLVSMGCRLAMELDINGTWPQFTTYTGFGTSHRVGVRSDDRMTNPGRYLTGSSKDFIALFSATNLPAGAVG